MKELITKNADGTFSYDFEKFFTMDEAILAEQDIKYSTIGQIKTNLITVLNWCSKYGVQLNPSYNEVYLPNYISSKISLTADEISHIYHYKIGASESYSFRMKKVMKYRKNKILTLEKVRDMFVLGCNLGQRYSDMVRISPNNFRNGQFIITQQKTAAKCFCSYKHFEH
jgi:hypothetical protein